MWLSFERVSIGYNGHPAVLEEVAFRLSTGLWVLTGGNGSGKSSLLRCAAGILRPRSGTVRWNGEDAWARPLAYRYCLGYAPQELHGLPDTSAREYLAYLGSVKGIRPAFLGGRIMEVMALTGAPHGRISLMSAGERRRVVLAAALLNDPDLLVLDEPTADLDPEEKVRLRMLLADLGSERIILLSTHVPEELEGVAEGGLIVSDKGVTMYADRTA